MTAPTQTRSTDAPLVTCRVEGGIADVRLNRPDKLNALTIPTLVQLRDTARALAKDRALRGVILSGEGDTFCAGLDIASTLNARRAIARALVPRPWQGTNVFQESCWAWRRVPVPVVAAVRGHCLGGGLQIALGADYRFTTPDATWSVLEGKWGLIPDMSGMHALSQQVGLDVAKRLTWTAEMFDGAEAVRLGVASEVADDPFAAAQELLARVATRSPDTVAAGKRVFEGTWGRGARHTFSRERIEQVKLLLNPNTRRAQKAGMKRETPSFLPRR